MRKVMFILLFVGALGAPSPFTTWDWASTIITWDPVTLDIEGKPETIVQYELGLFVDGSVVKLMMSADVQTGITALKEGAPDGLYEIRVRAIDQAPEVSACLKPWKS